MNTVDNSVEAVGGTTKLSELMGVSRTILNIWRKENKVPYRRISSFSKITGHPVHELAPDLFKGYFLGGTLVNLSIGDTLLLIGSSLIEKSNKARDDGRCVNSYRGNLFALMGISEALELHDFITLTLDSWAKLTIDKSEMLQPINYDQVLESGEISSSIIDQTFKNKQNI